MASRQSKSPSTPSEGEIIESGSDTKAATQQTTINDTHVDHHRNTRADSRVSSRSPQPAVRSFRRERSSRSRSPYQRPRGEKRRRDDGYDYDRDSQMIYSRQAGSRYDDRYRGNTDFDRRRRDYYDYDWSDRYEGGRRYNNVKYDGRSEKRPRTRSRSPFRAIKGQWRYPGEEDSRGRSADAGRARSGDRRSSTKQSVSERGKPSVVAQGSKQEAEQRENQVPEASSAAESDNTTSAAHPDNCLGNGVSAGAIDEAALIEQRRRRREAIKAKYRNQPSPLPAEIGKADGEAESTAAGAEKPDNSRANLDVGTTGDSTLNTPDATSGAQSPTDFKIAKDEDLVNEEDVEATSVLDQEGPSAVDYDPTKDMREDKMKHDKRHFADELSAGAYDETVPAKHELLVPESTGEQPSHMKVKDPFDMFAPDDDDMFAEGVSTPSTKKDDTAAGKPGTAQPQELDMSMMDNWDDPEGYYNVMLGELINGRYHVQQNLGKGMFSSVVRATDSKTGRLVAVKIIRNNDTMRKAGLKEIDILERLCTTDPDDKKHVIRFERQFDHKGHLCMVFENLSMNLREVLKKFGRDVGLNLRAIRAYAQQMFLGLSLLRKCSILHADLKPDNLLVNESRNLLKMCDLGSASPASESEITPYLVSRFYRAPEIMLGIPYDYAIDVWSIGCTLFELYTGKILFTGRTNNQMLRSIMECRGKFPPKLLRRGMLTHLHFDDLLNFRSLEEDKVSGRMVTKMLDFKKPTRDLKTRLMGKGQRSGDAEAKEVALFVDLLERCLNLNPEKRCTPSEALKHPFVSRPKT